MLLLIGVESRHSCYRLTPDEFLNNPELQLKIIEHKLRVLRGASR